jgi:putative pyruvate formate lyase activating enzyme
LVVVSSPWPAYLGLGSGEVAARAESARRLLGPGRCGVRPRGRNGSGTIFFSGCNLRCVFCQNYDISWQVHGEPVTPRRLAAMMLALQDRGCSR